MMKVRGMREKGNKKRRGCFQLRRLIVSSIAVFPVSENTGFGFDYKPFRLLRGMEFPQQSAHAQKSRAIK